MYYNVKKIIGIGILAMILVGLPFSCAKENPVDKLIPNVTVNYRFQPNSPQFVPGPNGNGDLTIPGNWAYIHGEGYRGLIVFNTGFADFRYRAFERTAPYEFPNDDDCIVEVTSSGLFALDPCSNTRYNLFDNGYPDQGPGVLPLKQYQTTFDGTYVYIFN